MGESDEFTGIKKQILKLRPLIEAHSEHSEGRRRLCNKVARAMAIAGLYRVAVPASLNGAEAHPVTQIKTIEAVSEIHGSTGWNLMIGIENMGILSALYDRSVTKKLYSDPGLIIAGTLNPLGQAVKVDGGYRINGQWPFASGIHNAQYFWSQSIVHEDGQRVKDDAGFVFCESMVPVEQVEILDTWHVAGMRGSGSHDVKLTNVFVPDEYISRVQMAEPLESGTLYRLPIYSRLAYNKVGVATGLARGAIQHFMDLAGKKKPRGSSISLQFRTDAQRAVAEAERMVGSARSYVFEIVSGLLDTGDRGNRPSDKQKARVQLACSGAADESVKAVGMLYSAAGASANFLSSPLAASMRDVLVVRQHIMVSPQYTDAIGRVLMGMESGSFLF